MSSKYTIRDFQKDFSNDNDCLEYIFQLRRQHFKTCLRCKAENSFYRVSTRKCYSCSYCGYQVSPTAGTIFHKSSTNLSSWFYALFLVIQSRRKITTHELQRHLGVTYKTAWRMLSLLRQIVKKYPDSSFLLLQGSYTEDSDKKNPLDPNCFCVSVD